MCKINCYLYLLFLFLLPGCAKLPDYALPQPDRYTNSNLSFEHGITYRPLDRDDFRAENLPGSRKGHAQHLSANISTRIRPTKSTSLQYDTKTAQNQTLHQVKVKKIAFEAVMLPDRSWWSPQTPPMYWPYILQHEQIHFTITELAARQLTCIANKELQNLTAIGATKKDAEKQLKGQIARFIKKAQEQELQKHLKFDQETSLCFNPNRQQEWYEEMTAQLRKTSPNKTFPCPDAK